MPNFVRYGSVRYGRTLTLVVRPNDVLEKSGYGQSLHRALKPIKILIIDAVWGISVRIIRIVDAVWGIFIVFFVINQPNSINNISFRTTLEAPTDPETNFLAKMHPTIVFSVKNYYTGPI